MSSLLFAARVLCLLWFASMHRNDEYCVLCIVYTTILAHMQDRLHNAIVY